MSALTVTVIIPTYNRPDCVRRCLACLMAQEPRPDQIIVVDASPDTRTRDVVAEFEGVEYIANPDGRGNTPNSRNKALARSRGDIIAFLDDDAFVHPGWSAALLETYEDETVAGVAGRALNHQPGEESRGVNEIGLLKPNGVLTGYFAADPGRIVEVDHGIGCNMSLRRSVIAELGGFRDDFRAGPFGICEETELCIRARKAGYQMVFNPAVCCDHIGAAQPGGRRFSVKYDYYVARNTLVMLLRIYGPLAPIVWRYLGRSLLVHGALEFLRRIAAAFARLGILLAGTATGLAAGLWLALTQGTGPIRHGREAEELREQMGRRG
jgi:GT2 family glycosyltransferase